MDAEHPWLQDSSKVPNVLLGEVVRSRLKQFSMMNKLKKRALRVINSNDFIIFRIQIILSNELFVTGTYFLDVKIGGG